MRRPSRSTPHGRPAAEPARARPAADAPRASAPQPEPALIATFAELALIAPLQAALRDEKYERPTSIQSQAIPHLLGGRDLLGCARTGTGKTAAFALPILQRLSTDPRRSAPRSPRALVLVPTRELAAQVAESFSTYGKRLQLTVAVIYGGVGQANQVRRLEQGVDILVATPGRLLDLISQRHVRLDLVGYLVLDEADQMLDHGFLPDVRRILGHVPAKRQTLVFSATMPPPIAELADRILSNPVKVVVTPVASTSDEIDQSVHFATRAEKPALLAKLLFAPEVLRALVFTRTKRGADRVAKKLVQDGIPAEAIHGNKSQNNRERTLDGFKRGRTRVLVATDIAARGIDVEGITHVINYELPNVPESYVHRIGRTARAGATGAAISLCDSEERPFLRDIEKLTKRTIRVASTGRGDGAPQRGPSVAAQRSARAPQRSSDPMRDIAAAHERAQARGAHDGSRRSPQRQAPGPSRGAAPERGSAGDRAPASHRGDARAPSHTSHSSRTPAPPVARASADPAVRAPSHGAPRTHAGAASQSHAPSGTRSPARPDAPRAASGATHPPASRDSGSSAHAPSRPAARDHAPAGPSSRSHAPASRSDEARRAPAHPQRRDDHARGSAAPRPPAQGDRGSPPARPGHGGPPSRPRGAGDGRRGPHGR